MALSFPPDAQRMLYEENLPLALQHLEQYSVLLEEHEYAAAEYHRLHYLYFLPTQGVA